MFYMCIKQSDAEHINMIPVKLSERRKKSVEVYNMKQNFSNSTSLTLLTKQK